MSTLSDTLLEKYTFFWSIKNLRYSTLQNGEFITSPKFSVPNFQNTTWLLKFYPKGIDSNCTNSSSCCICRDSDNGPESITVKYNIGVSLTAVSFSGTHQFSNYKSLNLNKFLLQSLEVCKEEYLTIVFEMNNNPEEFSIAERFFPPAWKPDMNPTLNATEEIKQQMNAEALNLRRKLYAYSSKCFAQNIFCLDKKCITWPINSSIIEGKDCKQVIPAFFSEKFLSLIITMHCKKDDEEIKIDIRIVNGKIKKPTILVFKLFIFVEEAETYLDLVEEELVFNVGKEEEIWVLPLNVGVYHIISKLNDSSTGPKWNLELSFANGDVTSEVLWEDYVNIPTSLPDNGTSFITNKMLRLCEDKTMCDIVLKTRSKTFNLHKVVLATISPVFSKMIYSGMKESKTSIIEIVDFEEDILEELVSYIYTGKLSPMEFDKATKLFTAADKYEIFPLMNNCRNYLMENLTADNACEVLFLADMHNDSELQKAVVKIIRFYKSAILTSELWNKFEKENVVSANKILKEICLQCK